MLKYLKKIVLITVVLTFTVIILGAYTRLKDAGLGCPDWPGCYGHIFAPSVSDTFNQTASNKAWIEMIHRYVAGVLGLLIVFIAIQTRSILSFCILALVIFQALLGMWTVTLKLSPVIVMAHLLGGFSILGLLWWLYLDLQLED